MINSTTTAHKEPHMDMGSQKLNWLRAAVLGANDGLVSIAALVVGIAGATSSSEFIVTACVAGILSGALSMAVGEYVSVSTQRDTERALIAKEKQELLDDPVGELEELTKLYQAKGLDRVTAFMVATELTRHDAFAAHAESELHIDPDNLTNPWYAAFASAIAFTIGGIIPALAITLPPDTIHIPVTFAAVFVALIVTGTLSASAGGAGKMRATLRVVFGGIAAMCVTFGIGLLFGVAA